MSHEALSGHTCKSSFLPCIVQSWRGTVPAGFEWTMTLAAGREHCLFGGHDSLYARRSGLFRHSLWLGQVGPPPACKAMSMSMSLSMSGMQAAMWSAMFSP